NNNRWSIQKLNGLKIFEAAAGHVANGRQYHFVSLIPCGPLRELTDRARKSSDITNFTQLWLTSELRAAFDELSATEVLGSAEAAWTTLRGMWFEVHDEHDIIQVNDMLAEQSLDGQAGHLTTLALGDILLNNLGKTLTRDNLLTELKKQGILPLRAKTRTTAREQTRTVTESWLSTIRRELLEPSIEREEVGQLLENLKTNRLGLIVGTAGGGKSAVLEQAVSSIQKAGGEVLAFRLDRLEPFTSTASLGRQLGVDTSPAVALTLAADERDAYLVIDQLDAVSLASGRMHENFDVVMDLIGEALSVPGVRIILACREFDVENDHRIRKLATRADMSKIQLGMLTSEAVDSAVQSMGLDPNSLTSSQRELLRSPLNLVLLETNAGQSDALDFQSRGSLFDAFWERKRQASKSRRNNVRVNEVIARIANAASDRQVLSVPVEILDEGDLVEDANLLVSEHVLAHDGGRIAFFHETFFDYAFARQWASRSESLIDFLRRDEQELFRRAQVRQILQHLYERDHSRFVQEIEALLTSSDIRFHIKETALAVLAKIPAPTSEEAEMVMRIDATNPSFTNRLWQQLRQPQWFQRFYKDGMIT
ncbi:MAG: ATP-binding protein, partial [Candidatus Saccharibacteria bacterium]|nr:ATP-binding protein [Candidatus Saccharibacteria bacterium]